MKLVLKSFTVTIAGATAQRMTSADIKTPSVIIQADDGNTNGIFIGDSSTSTSKGHELDALESLTLNAKELGFGDIKIALRDIYLAADTASDKANITYLEQVKDTED